MHYSKTIFSKDGKKPTIQVKKEKEKEGCAKFFGEQNELSGGDVGAVDQMYENRPPITTVQVGDGSGQKLVSRHAYRYEAPSGTLYYSSQLEPNSNK